MLTLRSQLGTLSIDHYHLVINPTNIRDFGLKLPGDAAPLRKPFHYILCTKIFYQIYFLRAALNMTIYRKM